jgi:glutaminyl-tRNA synthetase
VPFSRELWIEREDFMETPSKGYFRLFPGNKVRLRYGYVVNAPAATRTPPAISPRCTATICRTPSPARPAPTRYKVKGNIHWVSAAHAYEAEVRCTTAVQNRPAGAATGDFLDDINADSVRTIAPSSNLR